MSFLVVEKPIPDDRRPGVPDPRVLQQWIQARQRPRRRPTGLSEIRESMGWENLDLSSQVTTEDALLPGRGGPVPGRIYRPNVAGIPGAIVYFHGGGFVGGSLKTVENPCRLLAERAGALVFSIAYRLAPEHPFPAGLDDCWDAVKAVVDDAATWGIDPRRVAVAGDSAGGNLASACCILDARQAVRRIAAQLLVYPVVDLRSPEGHLPWSEDEYDWRGEPELCRAAVLGFSDGREFFSSQYLQGYPAQDPLVSPVTQDPRAFPPTLVLTAEYDFLRLEGEAFARRLVEAGVMVRAVRYRGQEHAFLDKLGLFPQAADAVDEMASFFTAATAASDDPRLAAQLGFLLEIDKLKRVIRRNELADASRRENTAEHSWHLVMFALTLAEHAGGLDLGRVVQLCALHDLVEIDAGDTFFWDEKGYSDKEARERAAARRLFGLLPAPQGDHYLALWEEFEACQTPESVYANAVDRLAPVLLNSHSGGRSWRENGITAEKILNKMTVVAQASPRLGRALVQLVQAAQAKGILPSP